MFNALLPMSKDNLLKIVRENAEEENDRRHYFLWHIDCTMALIFGGAQFKAETDLWSTERKGMMPPPDFGRVLSRDRFKRIVRYWSRGLRREREKLRGQPWAQVDSWVKGFNAARLRELCVGSSLTPDVMMLEWKGKSGHGGIPHLSFIKRKPQPLGTELKSVCEGTFGICVYIEIQKNGLAHMGLLPVVLSVSLMECNFPNWVILIPKNVACTLIHGLPVLKRLWR